ncbi:MAG TPA: hypothetical protein VJ755_09395 [Gemmatimonadales bacterium]|nr:hypothetical protein [Gemmatimonadales bacterium]
MKRTLILVGLLFGLMAGVSQAQTRVGVSLSFGDPYVAAHIVIGRPYHHRHTHRYYHRYRSYYHRGPLIIVEEPRVIVVRRHRHHVRRHHRHRD